jgi:hypothetical protein
MIRNRINHFSGNAYTLEVGNHHNPTQHHHILHGGVRESTRRNKSGRTIIDHSNKTASIR